MRLEISANQRFDNSFLYVDDSNLFKKTSVEAGLNNGRPLSETSKDIRSKSNEGSLVSSLDIKVPGGTKKTTPPKPKRMRRRRSVDLGKDYYYQNEDKPRERTSSKVLDDSSSLAAEDRAKAGNRSSREFNSDVNWKTSSRAKSVNTKSSTLRNEDIPFGQWFVLISLVLGFAGYHYHRKIFGNKDHQSLNINRKKIKKSHLKTKRRNKVLNNHRKSKNLAPKKESKEVTLESISKSSPDSISTDGSSSTNENMDTHQDPKEHAVKQVVVSDVFNSSSLQDDINKEEWTTVRSGSPKRNVKYNTARTKSPVSEPCTTQNDDLKLKSSDEPDSIINEKLKNLETTQNNKVLQNSPDQPDNCVNLNKTKVFQTSEDNDFNKVSLVQPDESVIDQNNETTSEIQDEVSEHSTQVSVVDVASIKPLSATGDVEKLNFIEKDEALSNILKQDDVNVWTTVRSKTPKRNKNYNKTLNTNTDLAPKTFHNQKKVDLNQKSSDQPHYSSKKAIFLQTQQNNDLKKNSLDQTDNFVINEKANVLNKSYDNNQSKKLPDQSEGSVIIEGNSTLQAPQNVSIQDKSSDQDSVIDQNEVTQISVVKQTDVRENKAAIVAQPKFSEKDDEVFARLLQQQEDELAVANFADQSRSLDDEWEEVQHKKRRNKKA